MNSESLQTRIPWPQLFILTGGVIMAFIDTSIVNVALPRLMSTFGVGLDSIQWVTTAYLLAAGVTIPAAGFLSDSMGLKNTFLSALAVFTLGSALASVARSEDFLVAARVVQAVGGGALMPVSTSYIYQIIDKDRIGLALGTRSIATWASPAFGTVLGGYLVDHFDWHIIFAINLPVSVLTILLGAIVLPRIPGHGKLRLDLPGLALITAGAFSLLLGLSRGQDAGWHSPGVVLELTAGVFALILFVLWELTTDHPTIDLRVFQRNAVLPAALAGIFLVTVATNGVRFLMPVFIQQILGFSASQTGLLVAPAAVVMGIVWGVVPTAR